MSTSAGRARRAKETPQLRILRAQQAIETAISLAGPLPPPCARPALAVLSGLPGAGKSTFAAALRQIRPIAILASDDIRTALITAPTYSKAESGHVFSAIRAAAAELLAAGHDTLIDATNLIEAERAILYRAAAETGARLVVVLVTAPREAVHARLKVRFAADATAADSAVYERMKRLQERIARPHFVVDMSGEFSAAVQAVAREIAGR